MKTLLLLGVFYFLEVQGSVINGSYAEGGFKTSNATLEYIPVNNDHPCHRKCVKDEEPMLCEYIFEVEWYRTLSKACFSCPQVEEDCYKEDCIIGDGVLRTVTVVNRKLPGPSIEVCHGDKIIVDVVNLMMTETTSIHWHGHYQVGTPYMDGVPFVTQCPIHPGVTFRYNLTAQNAGTHFWHSHTGLQRGDGAFGAFIVRTPEEDNPHAELYDFDLSEHILSLIDWDVDLSINIFADHHHSTGDNKPSNILINGLGIKNFTDFNENEHHTPIARFSVKKGFRYRFRIINAGFLNCPVEMSVDDHDLRVISIDGNDIKPVTVQSLVSYAGERFDFVIDANQNEKLYWIRVRGLMDCDERFTSAHQVAVFAYEGVEGIFPSEPIPNYETSHREGTQLNSLNVGTENSEEHIITIPELQSVEEETDGRLKEKPDKQIYVYYDFNPVNHAHFHKFPFYSFMKIPDKSQQVYTPQLNHISLKLQPFPLLPQRELINSTAMFCNEDTLKDRDCTKEFCQCTHVVEVELNSILELVLVDKGVTYDANHPFHLHGHSFRVVAMQRVGSSVTVEEIKEMDEKGLINRNLENPPIKDTVTIPDGGFTILRINASNPGYWIFHCHLEFHVEVGMAMIFKFGDHDQMPERPYKFPTCTNFEGLEGTDDVEKGKSDYQKLSLVTLLTAITCQFFLHF